MTDFSYIKSNYHRVCAEIERAANGRDVTLVCVTKSGSDEELLALASLGVTDIGENRPGELKRRFELLSEHGFSPRMHEIGNLQRNKVKSIIDVASLIHSVDNLSLAKEIDKLSAIRERVTPVLLEVNCAKEESKGGVYPEDAERLLAELSELRHISVAGIMTMGPRVPDPELLRPYFRQTKSLFDELSGKYAFACGGILSMGMSDSFTVAIEEGSTLVRVGTKLFEK